MLGYYKEWVFKKITQYSAIAGKYYNSGNVLEIIETETIHFIIIYSVYD